MPLRSPLFITAAVSALLPFAIDFHTSSSTTVNGVTHLVYRDFVALACGAAAVLLALIFAFFSAAPGRVRVPAGAVVALLGALQLARGFGLDRGASLTSEAPPPECSDDEPQLCRGACERGEGEACDRWGVALGKGLNGVEQDLDAALAAFQKGCAAKVGNACANAAIASTQQAAPDLEQARAFAKQACELGNATGCYVAGNLLAGNNDAASALAMYEKACALGVAEACNRAGVAYDHGTGAAEDAEKAYGLFVEACKRKSTLGCVNQGHMLRVGRGTAKDGAQSAALLERACEHGSERGCDEYGIALLFGDVPKDAPGEARTFGAGCDAGALTGCFLLGVRYRDGNGVAADEERALGLFTQVCDQKNAAKGEDACAMRGLLLAKRDPVAAKPLLTDACKAGYRDACGLLKAKKKR